MNNKQIKLIKHLLGDDFFDTLKKSEISGGIMKLNTNTATDPNEIKVALQIVPRSILTYLFMNLKHCQVGEVIDLDLPFADAQLHINKLSLDNYSGEIIQHGKKLSEFKYRSLPGVGLILMSSLELYDTAQLDEIKPNDYNSEKAEKLQDVIDERIKLYSLIQNVVNQKIMEKDAIKEMIRQRLTQELFTPQITMIEEVKSDDEENIEEKPMQDKKGKLKEFLEQRQKKNEKDIELDKSEIKCPDCDHILYKGEDKINLCVCYGEHFNKNLKIKKNEDGSVKIKFPKDFGVDNVEMLLEALKNMRG